MNIKLISGWWQNFYKLWSVQVAALGLMLPELLQLLADNSAFLPHFDENAKSLIRMLCLAAVIVLRGIRQERRS